MTLTLLHPGEMGAAIGACLVPNGHRVVWASENRSQATRRRAQTAGLEDLQTLDRALAVSEAVLSICPPDSALEVASQVAARNFRGIYIDANAISPNHSREIARLIEANDAAAGAPFVDAGIIGRPPTPARPTRLYLAGPHAKAIAALFADTPTEAIPLEAPVGAASALKVCYAAYTKGETALLAAIRALAKHENVDAALLAEWNHSQPGVAAKSELIADRAPKAWRWAGEMEQIAAAFADAGLPSGFLANAEIYRRLAEFKDSTERPSLEEIAERLHHTPNASAHRAR